MTTSGSYNYSTNATKIISAALFKVGAAQEGEDIPPEQLRSGLESLNNLIKFIASKNSRNLWRRDEVYIFLAKSQARYLLGPATTDAEWCMEEDFIATKLNGEALSGAKSITVDSTAGMALADRVGVELTDGTMFWTAIGAVASSTALTIPALTGAASDNGVVYTYTTRPQRPLRFLHARRKSSDTGEDIPIDVESQELYRDQPSKTSNGTPVFVTYKPTLVSGRLEVWQRPSASKMIIGASVERPFEDFDAASDEPDIPQEWYDPLVFMLADRIEGEYRVLDPVRLQILMAKAKEMWEWVNDFDDDLGSTYLQLDNGS